MEIFTKLTALIRKTNLRLKLGSIPFLFLIISISNFFIIKYYKSVQEKDGLVIDIAGRQRMLSQRIAFLTLQALNENGDPKVLNTVIDLCDKSLNVLEFGGQAPGMKEGIDLPPSPASILPTLKIAKELWQTYKTKALSVSGNDSQRTASSIFIQENALEMLKRFNALVQAYVQEGNTKQAFLDKILLVLLMINIVILVCGFLINNRIVTRPVLKMNEFIQNLAKGKLGSPIEINSGDELGVAMTNLKQLDENLRYTSNFAINVSKGNLDTKLNLLSEDDELGLALNNMQDNLKRSVDDVSMVVQQAGHQGDLSVRINSEDKEGAWMILSNSINSLLASIEKPIKNIETVVMAMAEGDLSQRCSEGARGDLKSLIDSLNHSLIQLGELILEVADSTEYVDKYSGEMLVVGKEMNVSTEEIATSITEMSNGAGEQVLKMEESSHLVENIAKSSENMGILSNQIDEAAQLGVRIGSEGAQFINKLVEIIESVSDSTKKAQSSMDVLSERSGEISRVLGVISDIAAQTNLLALNAAIEAAQAGDAGRGFAVVAEEIRKLAEDSRRSAGEIEKLIMDVQTDTNEASKMFDSMILNVQEGVKSSNEASNIFTEITNSSERTLSFSQTVLESTKNQAADIKSIVQNTENVLIISEETAAGTEEVASSASQLAAGMKQLVGHAEKFQEMAQKLKTGVSRFSLEKQKRDMIDEVI